MTLLSLQQLLPQTSTYHKEEPSHLQIEDVKIYQTDDMVYLIDGYSEYEELPRRFSFVTDEDVVAYLVPFILQTLDGQERV